MAEAMDSVLWDYAPERERTPRGYSAGDFFDSFSWTEREAEAGAPEGEDEARGTSGGGGDAGDPGQSG